MSVQHPVLFFPGTLCDERIFMPLWQALPAHQRRYVPLQWAASLDDMLALSKDRLLEGEKVHLVGYSMGGYGAVITAGGGVIANTDGWDGYYASRERLVQALGDAGNPNFIVLTGDVHSSWAFDIATDPSDPAAYDPVTGAGSVGVEFVTTSVTSNFPGEGAEQLFLAENPHLHWAETASRGYLIVDLTPDRAEAAWYHVSSVQEPEANEQLAKVFSTVAGTQHLEEQAQPSLPPTSMAPLAP